MVGPGDLFTMCWDIWRSSRERLMLALRGWIGMGCGMGGMNRYGVWNGGGC